VIPGRMYWFVNGGGGGWSQGYGSNSKPKSQILHKCGGICQIERDIVWIGLVY
jgi:hypothetical protein